MPGLIWQPYFSPLPIIACGVGVAVLALIAYARTFRQQRIVSTLMLIMRLALIAGVTMLLLGPSFMPESRTEPGRGELRIVVDLSSSMQSRDVAGATRYDVAAQNWLSDDQLEQLSQHFDVTLVGFDAAPQRIDPSLLRQPPDRAATGDHTNLAESLRQTIGDMTESGGSVLLLSDGRDTDDQSASPAADLARARSIRIHTVPLGGPSRQRDLLVTARENQPYLFTGEQGTITARIAQANSPQARTTLHLRRENGEDGTHISRAVSFDGRQEVQVQLPVEHEEAGLYRYEVAVDPLSNELEPANNTQSVFVRVTGERLRVLLLEGQPYWDTKFLAHALRRDERVALRQITQLSARRREQIVTRTDATEDMPRTMSDLREYDVIILGRSVEHVLPAETLELLPDYVGEHGGRLVLARGRPYDSDTPNGRAIGRSLSVLEPVVWGNGTLRDQAITLTAAGREHPSFNGIGGENQSTVGALVSRLPALAALPRIAREKASAHVLARTRPTGAAGSDASGQPAVVTMSYGRGMVMAMLGEGMWKWRLAGRNERELRGVFDRFWSGAVRWLAMGSDYQPGEPMSLRLARRSMEVGEPLELEIIRRFADTAPDAQLIVEAPDGTRTELTPIGDTDDALRRTATYTPDQTGIHRATLTAASLDEPVRAPFSVYDIDEERLRSGADPETMRQLADATRGQVFDARQPGELVNVLERIEASKRVPVQPEFLWDRAWVMVLLLGWAGAEWLIRKRGGLL